MGKGTSTESERPRAVCAIGASAGGLEALKNLFGSLPNDTGLAFVVIQHLDPRHPSILTSILASEVGMDAVEVTDGMVAQPNRIHVIPPAADLDIASGVLSLVPRQPSNKVHLPIDAFFQALANDQPGKAIGVVLSGSASDGTEGLRAIKRAGGITFAQSPESAQFRSMPESAVAAGVVDFCQAPEQIARELARLSHDSYLLPSADSEADTAETSDSDEDVLPAILAAINKHAQLDLRNYKRPTIERRVARRMALRGFTSLSQYAASLDDDVGESTLLAQEVLIHVTSFFRDHAAFQVLSDSILPALLERTDPDAEIRIWNPGCATGQETYSLGICLLEALAAIGRTTTIKLFGSDLSDRAIEIARAGVYSEADLEGVSPKRRARFFERVDGRYRISRQVRDQCVFVRHDLTRDPPFAKLDFIACRNVLIYFDPELQQRVVPLFHQCLNPQGVLFLGSSEALSGFGQLFAPIDKQHRIFMKSGESQGIVYPLGLGRSTAPVSPAVRPISWQDPAREAQKQVDNILLSRYAPPGVVVNEALQVVQFRGRTGAFLEQPAGNPQMNVLNLAREGLVIDLRDALEKAKAERITVRKTGVQIIEGQVARLIDIEVVPLLNGTSALERYFLVLFEAATTASPLPAVPALSPDEHVSNLKGELSATRDYLRLVSSEYQDAMQELATGNEEMVAGNEELQSTNEELQSAKEELQSTNEELTTLNDELRSRNQELDLVANDIVNVLGSVQIPVILVDRALRIRRFTPTADGVAWLYPESVGRSIHEVKLKVQIDDLADKIRETMSTRVAKEWEVQDEDDRWLRLHIRPYETANQLCEGAVLSFVDVDVLRHAVQDAERARDYARGIVETVPMILIVLDQNLRVTSVNPPFYDLFKMPPVTVQGTCFFDLGGGACNVAALRQAVEESLASQSRFGDLELRCEFQDKVRRNLRFAGCPIKGTEDAWMLLLAIEDVTEWRHLEAAQRRLRIDAVQANHTKDDFLATLAHELRGPLSTMLMSTHLLKSGDRDEPMIQRASKAIERAVESQMRLIEDLSDVSRIEAGKLRLSLEDLDLAKIVQDAVDVALPAAEAKGIACELLIEDPVGQVHGDSSRLQQVLGNLLTNAIKFTQRGGSVLVRLQVRGPRAKISVRDDGAGISAELIPHIFDRFTQVESAMSREHGGLGLGLTIVRHLVQIHGGEVHVKSPGDGKGTTFTVTLPLVGQPAAASAT